MKTKIFNKIICFAVAVCLTICCFLINSFSGNTVNAATDDVLANTEIKNDGSIISTDLWNALYRFYISENSDPNNFVTSFYPNSFKNFSSFIFISLKIRYHIFICCQVVFIANAYKGEHIQLFDCHSLSNAIHFYHLVVFEQLFFRQNVQDFYIEFEFQITYDFL